MNDKAERFDELVKILSAAEHRVDLSYPIYRITFDAEHYKRLMYLLQSPSVPSPAPENDAAAIALAESKYWQKQSDEKIFLLALGAMAAASNIYAAVSGFHRAPWHPKKDEASNRRDDV